MHILDCNLKSVETSCFSDLHFFAKSFHLKDKIEQNTQRQTFCTRENRNGLLVQLLTGTETCSCQNSAVNVPDFRWRFHHWQQRKPERVKWSVVPPVLEPPSERDPWTGQLPQPSRRTPRLSCTSSKCHDTRSGTRQTVEDFLSARVLLPLDHHHFALPVQSKLNLQIALESTFEHLTANSDTIRSFLISRSLWGYWPSVVCRLFLQSGKGRKKHVNKRTGLLLFFLCIYFLLPDQLTTPVSVTYLSGMDILPVWRKFRGWLQKWKVGTLRLELVMLDVLLFWKNDLNWTNWYRLESGRLGQCVKENTCCLNDGKTDRRLTQLRI